MLKDASIVDKVMYVKKVSKELNREFGSFRINSIKKKLIR